MLAFLSQSFEKNFSWEHLLFPFGESGKEDRNHALCFTFFVAAAAAWATGTADMTAAKLRAALAPAHSNQGKEENATKDDHDHCQPIWLEEKQQHRKKAGNWRLLSCSPTRKLPPIFHWAWISFKLYIKDKLNEVHSLFLVPVWRWLMPLKIILTERNQIRYERKRLQIWTTKDKAIPNGMWFVRSSFSLNCLKLLLHLCMNFLEGNLKDCLGEIEAWGTELPSSAGQIKQWGPGWRVS